jgi:hypothetical protein
MTAKHDTFSFRWGIDVLDSGFTTIPNWMFDSDVEAGVSQTEFLTVLRLTRDAYERPDSECSPSLTTVADQMGVTPRRPRLHHVTSEPLQVQFIAPSMDTQAEPPTMRNGCVDMLLPLRRQRVPGAWQPLPLPTLAYQAVLWDCGKNYAPITQTGELR